MRNTIITQNINCQIIKSEFNNLINLRVLKIISKKKKKVPKYYCFYS